MTLRDYAKRHGLSIPAARAQLAELALRQLEARAKGGATTAGRSSPAERQARARQAIAARWARVRKADSAVRKDDSKCGVVWHSPTGRTVACERLPGHAGYHWADGGSAMWVQPGKPTPERPGRPERNKP